MGELTDLEITKRCAEAIDYKIDSVVGECCYHYNANGSAYKYDPLHDDAQAMALVKKFHLMITPIHNQRVANEGLVWVVSNYHGDGGRKGSTIPSTEDVTLNRAICECVAKLDSEQRPT